MKQHALLMTVVASLATAFTASPQAATDTPTDAAVPHTAAPAFVPGLDDLMTMLVQPRHIRLYEAGVQRNWELAASEARELRASFRRITQAIPTYLDNDVNDTLTAMIAPKLEAVDTAIAAADEKRFLSAYADLTAACNDCHAYMQHPFLVIKVPSGRRNAAYPDQVFSPLPESP
jgi:hypothetical protein